MLELGDAHLKKIEDMVIKQKVAFPLPFKTQVALDITNLAEKINLMIQSIKEENLRRLDNFFDQYCKSYMTLKQNIDSFFLLSRQNFYYSNQNTF